jgi:purine nucleoside permease
LNPGLVHWAYQFTKSVRLDDTDALRKIRAGYPDYPNAQKPPFVLKGDEVVASDWWLGKIMTTQAEQWTRYWTDGKGRLATTAMEDCGVLQSLTFLAQAKKVRLDRALVLRTGANYTLPPAGETAAQLLAQEASEDDVLSAYVPSLEAAYKVASPVVNELATHWEKYREQTPGLVP